MTSGFPGDTCKGGAQGKTGAGGADSRRFHPGLPLPEVRSQSRQEAEGPGCPRDPTHPRSAWTPPAWGLHPSPPGTENWGPTRLSAIVRLHAGSSASAGQPRTSLTEVPASDPDPASAPFGCYGLRETGAGWDP